VRAQKLRPGHTKAEAAALRNEVVVLHMCRHPCIVLCMGSTDTPDSGPAMVVELVEGGDLKDALRRKARVRLFALLSARVSPLSSYSHTLDINLSLSLSLFPLCWRLSLALSHSLGVFCCFLGLSCILLFSFVLRMFLCSTLSLTSEPPPFLSLFSFPCHAHRRRSTGARYSACW